MKEEDIYKNVGKHRWPYVDEPRPKPPSRPGAANMPAALGPKPRPVTSGEAVDV